MPLPLKRTVCEMAAVRSIMLAMYVIALAAVRYSGEYSTYAAASKSRPAVRMRV